MRSPWGALPTPTVAEATPFGMFAPAVSAIIMRLFIHDRSPWVLGMIVRRDGRGAGIGSLLLARLERRAYRQGYELLWVATEGAAAGFYQRCGWRIYEMVDRDFEPATVLTKEPRAEPM
jgi:GNAT superfamily N-acetyltransferase